MKATRKTWFTLFWLVWSLFAFTALGPVHADDQSNDVTGTIKSVTDGAKSVVTKKSDWDPNGDSGFTEDPTTPAETPPKQAKPAGKNAPSAITERRINAAKKERILNYDIAAVIDRDASMTVTERLTVLVNHIKIRRGITRTYPVKMRDGEDGLYNFGFELLSTKLDGEDVPNKYSTKGMMVGMAIGDANKRVPRGVHTYEITYKTTGHVRSLDEHDEIYYNAVGLDVSFPVDKATFSLTLPDGTKPILTKAFTGRAGEKGEDYRMTGEMSFATTRTLLPKEAFTVVVGWPKGVVKIPERPWLNSHRNEALLMILGLVIAILAGGYFLRFRRNRPEIVHPLFTPPNDLSPGKAAYIDQGKYSPVMLQSDLIWSAVKGYCKMNGNRTDQPTFKWADKEGANSKSMAGAIAFALFRSAKTLILGYSKKDAKKPHTSLTQAWKHLYQYYKRRLKDNTSWRLGTPVAALAAGYLALYGILDKIWHPGLTSNFTNWEMIWVPGIVSGIVASLAYWTCLAWNQNRHKLLKRLWVLAYRAASAGFAFLVLYYVFNEDLIFTIFYALMWALPVLFAFKWNSVLNEEGLKDKAVTEGLKMYINTAEKHRLAIINAPEDSVSKYEEILPYAIALGCAEAWNNRYGELLDRLNYMPSWIERPAGFAGGLASDAWDAQQRLLYARQMRALMTDAINNVPVSVNDAIDMAIAKSQETRSRSSGGGSSGGWSSSGGSSGSSGGSSGGGSGGGGVGGW